MVPLLNLYGIPTAERTAARNSSRRHDYHLFYRSIPAAETATGSEGTGCAAALGGGVKLGTVKVGGVKLGGPDPRALPTATPTLGAGAAAAACGRTDGMRAGAIIACLACGAVGTCPWAKPGKPCAESVTCRDGPGDGLRPAIEPLPAAPNGAAVGSAAKRLLLQPAGGPTESAPVLVGWPVHAPPTCPGHECIGRGPSGAALGGALCPCAA